jgi:hypothetical protein
MKARILCMFLAAIYAALASGGPTGVPGVTPPNAMEVRTLSERVPAGGTVQVKYLLTQPRPISTGGSDLFMGGFAVNGVSLSSPLGTSAGVAVARNGSLSFSVISPDSDFGSNLDYPFITVTLTIPSTTVTGSTYPLTLSNALFQSPTGSLAFTDPKPGTLTVGGSVSIKGLVPGGGTWPAGSVIKLQGSGFSPATKLASKMKISNPVYVSPTEMRFTLVDTTTLDMQPVQAGNPDGSQVTYYSYLRGVLVRPPSQTLLMNTEPVFQLQTHGLATVGPIPSLSSGQFIALAVQNPNPGPVSVTFQLQSTGATTSVVLPSGGRIMDELGALLGGLNLNAGDVVNVNATAGVQILGLTGDENATTVTPFLPTF